MVLGHDIGIHGQLAGRATFRGPVDGLTLDGTLELTDLHRWDLLPPYAEGGPLRVRGRLDLPAQAAEIETVPDARSAIGLRLRAWDYLAQPRWVVGATLHGFPIAPLAEVGRHMGLALGAGERPEGVVSGAVAYSPDSGLQGALLADGFSLSAPERLPLKAESVRLLFDGDRTTMPPAVVTIGEEDRATLRFDYSLGRHQLDLRLDTGGMGLAMLSPSSGPVPGLSRPDFAGVFRSGQWSGRLAFHGEGDSPGAWSGTLQLRDAVAALDGLSDPVRIAAANVSIQKDGGVRASGIEAASGGLEFRGEYVFQPGASRPERIAGRVARARLSDVDRLLGPTLHRPRGLLSRTLRLDRGALPDWLAARRLHGSLEIGELEIAGETIESLQLDFYWDGASIDVPRYSARALGGELDGYLSLDLRAADPSLRVAGRLETPRWRGGSLVGEGVLAASGSAETIRRNLRAEGQFRLHNASLGPGAPIPQLAGDWNLFWEKGVPRLRLDALRLTEGDEVFTGQGGAIALDRLEAGLALGDRRVRLSGALRPLSLSRSEGR